MARPLLTLLVTIAVVTAGCTAAAVDSDGDGLRDVDEKEERLVSVTTPDGDETRRVTSDTEKVDTDGDGLTDYDEFSLGTDPRSLDSDGDGLLDGKSLRAKAGSKLHDRLRAAAIVEDPNDAGLFLGELSLCVETGRLDPLRFDSDKPLSDGLGDGDELRGWDVNLRDDTYRVQSSPCHADTDGDGLDDSDEREAGADPTNEDTDGDGDTDLVDADPLWDLGLRLTLESIRLKADKDITGGADLRFAVNVAGTERSFSRDVDATGEHSLGFEVAADVSDSSPSRESLRVPVVVRVLDDDGAQGQQAVEVSPAGGAVAEITLDLFTGEVTVNGGGASTGFAGASNGAEATLRFSFQTTRQ